MGSVKKYIAYLRVSTKRQGESGLGLEAQRGIVKAFVGGDELIHEYVEVESGKRGTRPQLEKALEHCKSSGATLVVAKLDRLYRNVYFTAKLMESEVKFVCCDALFADRFSIHILAAVAEWEASRISERTKAALGVAKSRGKKLGSPKNLTWEAKKKGAAVLRDRAVQDPARKKIKGMVELLLSMKKNVSTITDELNKLGYTAPKGGPVNMSYVSRIVSGIKSETRC